MNIGERIYELRQMHNMSQGDLADALDVSRQSISKWENNSATPELGKLVQICEYFEISLDELVRGKVPECAAKKDEEERWFGIKKEVVVSVFWGIFTIYMFIKSCFFVLQSITYYIEEKTESYKYSFDLLDYLKRQPYLLLQGICGIIIIIACIRMIMYLRKRQITKISSCVSLILMVEGIRVCSRALLINGSFEGTVVEWFFEFVIHDSWSMRSIGFGICLIGLGLGIAIWYKKNEGKRKN